MLKGELGAPLAPNVALQRRNATLPLLRLCAGVLPSVAHPWDGDGLAHLRGGRADDRDWSQLQPNLARVRYVIITRDNSPYRVI